MAGQRTSALSEVLDQLEDSAQGESIAVAEVPEKLGHSPFAPLLPVLSLIRTSPASAIPGPTAARAATLFILVLQTIVGRDSVWLPGFITRRKMSTEKLCKGIRWLRKPVWFLEQFLKPRLTFLFHRPWLWLPLILIL